MKKIISLVLCLVLDSFILSGCSNSSETFEEKSYMSDTQINEINLDVRDREIEVSASADEQIHIQYSENNKEYYDIYVSDENVLTMASVSDKEWTDYIGAKTSAENRKISLQIPDILLENLTLSTTNEDITLSALTIGGSVTISSNGGDIVFESLDVGSALTLDVKNGDISGVIAGSYDDFAIQSEIKKGESNLPDNKDSGEKTLKVSGNNGDVNIEFGCSNNHSTKEEQMKETEVESSSVFIETDTEDSTDRIVMEPEIVDADWSEYFNGLNGTAVVYDATNRRFTMYNGDLALTRRPPCSTFKIISSLIALENGIFEPEDSTRTWSGEVFWNEDWNKDIDFNEAFRTSCVWYYRQVIDDIGKDIMQRELEKLQYGNCDISDWVGWR